MRKGWIHFFVSFCEDVLRIQKCAGEMFTVDLKASVSLSAWNVASGERTKQSGGIQKSRGSAVGAATLSELGKKNTTPRI